MKTLFHGIIIASGMILVFFYGMYEGYKMGREDEREIKKQLVIRDCPEYDSEELKLLE